MEGEQPNPISSFIGEDAAEEYKLAASETAIRANFLMQNLGGLIGIATALTHDDDSLASEAKQYEQMLGYVGDFYRSLNRTIGARERYRLSTKKEE